MDNTPDAEEIRPTDRPIDFYGPSCKKRSYTTNQCKQQLMQDFPWLYASDIRMALDIHRNQYAKTHRTLTKVMGELDLTAPKNVHNALKSSERDGNPKRPPRSVRVKLTDDNNSTEVRCFHRMVTKRQSLPQAKSKIEPQLLEEIQFIKKMQGRSTASLDSSEIIEHDIECACCFGSVRFEETAQCCEGHLVCVECLTSYTREKVFGTSKLSLDCLTASCKSTYPASELKRCLPMDLQQRWEECLLEDSLHNANIDGLTRCPYCQYAAITSPSSKVFRCQKEDCMKLTCRQCGVDWEGHMGNSCAQMERNEVTLRKTFEERMTKSKVRICKSCNAKFLKESGCNKMTCRCGATMCYVCRDSEINYSHFCQHLRSPGKSCRQCSACSLWTTTEEDDELAIKELQKEANERRKRLGFSDDKVIGVPEDKKRRLD